VFSRFGDAVIALPVICFSVEHGSPYVRYHQGGGHAKDP